MKINTQKREENKVFLEVEEDFSRFEEAIQQAIVEAGRDVRLPGFRPGKAPKEMIEKALDREYVEHKAAQSLIADLYHKIIDESKIDPVDYPNVEITQQQKDKPFAFKITVDVYPNIKLGKYKGLKGEKKSTEVTEEEVLKVLGNLQERFTVADAEGKKERLPLDDEFAKKVSSFGTLAELKEEVHSALTKEKTMESENDLKNKLVALASDGAKADIPSAMVEREIDVMLDELRGALSQSGLTLEDYLKGIRKEETALKEEMKKAAEIRVKGKVVLKAIAEEEKLTVTAEDLSAELAEMARASGQSAEELEKNLAENGRQYINDYLLRRKALDLLVDKADIKLEKGEKKE